MRINAFYIQDDVPKMHLRWLTFIAVGSNGVARQADVFHLAVGLHGCRNALVRGIGRQVFLVGENCAADEEVLEGISARLVNPQRRRWRRRRLCC